MTMAAYQNDLPKWFLPYGGTPSAWYDELEHGHYTLDLGSVDGNKDTFCAYLFATIKGAKAVRIAIPIPVVHATLETAEGCLWIYGMSEKAKFWQGPIPGVIVPQQAAAVRSQAMAIAPMTVKQHDKLPVRWPGLFDALWEQRVIRLPHTATPAASG